MKEDKKKNKNTTFKNYFRKIENNCSNVDNFLPISNTLLDIIKTMLSFNPSDRPSIDNIVTNKYFEEYQYKLQKYKKSPVIFSLDTRLENALIETNDLNSIQKLICNECSLCL